MNFPNSLIVIWKKLLTCGIEKVDGLLCKLSFRLLSHYICTLSLLIHFVKHLSTSIMDFNNTISWLELGFFLHTLCNFSIRQKLCLIVCAIRTWLAKIRWPQNPTRSLITSFYNSV